MKNMKKTTIYVVALALIGILGAAGLVSAFGFGFADEQQRTAVRQAIENKDFASWKTAMSETMTQENFNRIAERHNKMFDRMELTKAVRQAIVDKDYAAYQLAAANLANSNNAMTAEEFNAVANGSTEQGFGGRFGHKGGFGGNCMRGQ